MRARRTDKVMPSRQRSVERRWLWWIIKPVVQIMKARKKSVVTGVMVWNHRSGCDFLGRS